DQGIALPLGLKDAQASQPVKGATVGSEDEVLAIVDGRFQCGVAGVLPEQALGSATHRRGCLKEVDLCSGLGSRGPEPIRKTAGRSEPRPTTANDRNARL
ncbi:MAG: hypothetical protein RJB19_891, partial [Pseudomonadota bacterium]